jgi:hypothetical protein
MIKKITHKSIQIFSLSIIILFFLFFSIKFSIIGNADDLAVLHIMKQGDGIVMILHYLTSSILVSLYKLSINIPWLSIMLFVFFIIGFTNKFLEISDKKNYFAITIFLLASTGCLWSINITSLTVYLTFCGISDKLKARNLFVLVLACLLRVELFVFCLIFFGILVIDINNSLLKKSFIIKIVSLVVIILLHYSLIHFDAGYKNFLELNKLRFHIIDQPGVSNWQVEKYNRKTNNAIYRLIRDWHFIDPRIIQAMKNASYKLNTRELINTDKVINSIKNNKLMLSCLLLMLVATSLNIRNRRKLLQLVTSLSILIILLIARDRQRVTVPLLSCILVYLVFLNDYMFKFKQLFLRERVGVAIASICTTLLLYNFFIYAKYSNFVQWTGCDTINYQEACNLNNLIEDNSEKMLILSIRIPSDYRPMLPSLCRKLFDESTYGSKNLILSGWTIFSSVYTKKLQEPFELSKYYFISMAPDLVRINKLINGYQNVFNECYKAESFKTDYGFTLINFVRCQI